MPPQAEGIALMDHARINSAIHEDDRSCFDFRASQVCRDAIAGRFPNSSSEADRIFHISEGIHLLQKQPNDLVHEANQAIYRVQQSWHMLKRSLCGSRQWLICSLTEFYCPCGPSFCAPFLERERRIEKC